MAGMRRVAATYRTMDLFLTFMIETKENDWGDYIEDCDAIPSETANPDCRELQIPDEEAGVRLDKVLSALLPEYSRSRIQGWITQGAVTLDNVVCQDVRYKVCGGEAARVAVMPGPEEGAYSAEEGIAFDVLYEDSDIIVINKPAGLVVHPAAGHWSGTLLNGLLARYPELSTLPRAGIVHRLDRETSGLMVVARSDRAQTDLVRQLQAKSVCREYWAIVLGLAPEAGFVDRSIGRDPRNPLKFTCRAGAGSRPAKTHCRLVDVAEVAGRTLSWIACRLETGRTHQIRVHLTSVGLPLVGDPLYKTNLSKLPDDAGVAATFPRQALHASRLRLVHPGTGETMSWFVEPPEDMVELMTDLGFGPIDTPTRVFD